MQQILMSCIACAFKQVCVSLVHSCCCKQAFLVIIRPKGDCVGCPAATLQCSLWQLHTVVLAQPHWTSACLIMIHGPKAMQLLQRAINTLQSRPLAASPLTTDFDGAVSTGEISLWLKHQWHALWLKHQWHALWLKR